MNAHPAIKTQLFDGWVLRFADGYTNRANSVNPIYPSAMPIEEKLSRCEEIYKSQGLPTTYKLTPLSFQLLDKVLDTKGYEKVMPTNVMINTITTEDIFASRATVKDKIDSSWQKDFFRLNGLSDDSKIKAAKTIQENILNKTLCASIIERGITVACGLCVVEQDYAGLFDIVVDSAYRRNGLGYDICQSLLNNAAKIGAKTAYLQVVADNAPAVTLYNKLGFNTCYQYWYRVKK
jgi:ribosomal protein S18 acetylase RimI-like enzyme